MNTRRAIGPTALALAALAQPWSAQAIEYTEAHAYGIASFGGAGQCGSSGQTHTVHTSTAGAFLAPFSAMQTLGQWNESLSRNNSLARGSYFTDASKAGTCACTADDVAGDYGVDAADVVYVHTHGGHTANAGTGAYRSFFTMGNSSYDCSVRTDDNMLFGDTAGGGDLGIAIIKACQGGDYDVWSNGGYRQQFSTTTGSFRVWNAFHGNSSCGSHVTTYVGDYANASTYEGIGENWLDEAYDDDTGVDNDDCPVSIVMGATSTQREDMYEHGGWLDRKATGDKIGSTYFYFAGCDPGAGIVLP
jgi:hypothetical protein